MRKIKFRIWSKINNSMSPSMPLKELCYQEYDKTLDPFNDNYVVWIQFTGLKDKNGKEIYEGDVVRRNNNEQLKEIVWNDTQIAGFAYQVGAYYNGIVEPSDELEIIGNIYEHPHLLSTKE